MLALTTCGPFRRIAAVALCVTALAVCNGCSDPSHAGEQGGESPLSDVLPPTAAALAEQASQSRDGRVLGTVRTARAGEQVALNGAVVSLEDGPNSIVAPTAVSDASGHFEIGSHPPGRYRLCAVSQGFTRTCIPEPVIIEEDTQYLAYDLTLRATSGALSGRLLLADGSPCFQYTAAFDTLVFADVTLRGPQGSIHAFGNDRGEFVLAGIPGPGDYAITAKCGGGEITQALTITRAQLDGSKSLDFTIANSRPVIRVLVPQDEHGHALRAFLPGQTIRVVAETVDRDTSDVLTYKWTDGTRGFKSVNARVIQWTLPSVEARSFLNVEVSDGKGGYAVRGFNGSTQHHLI